MEFASRLDDYTHLGVPFAASPDRQRDLMTRESWGFRGKPGGRFQKWKLNAFGFRGPEIAREPEDGTKRVLILGASETFGLLESSDNEYPAQLRRHLQQKGRYEIINASLAGMSLAAMNSYWDNWGRQFQPHIVLIYPSPIFYLRDDDQAPKYPARLGARPATGEHRFGVGLRRAAARSIEAFLLRCSNVDREGP
jgi:hypothetical protein